MSVLKKPLVTEKFNRLGEKLKQFSFVVDKKATKTEIKSAIEHMYSVNIIGVNTMIYAGKAKSKFTKRGHFSGRKPSFKKAIVKLQEGQIIDFFQNV